MGPRDESMSIRIEDVTAQKCGDSKVAEKWINGHCTMGQKHKAKIDHIQKTLYSRWTKRVAYSVERVDDYAKHDFRDHNKEDDHLTNLIADGQRKITVERGDNTENWKTVREFWDDSKKTDRRSGCGVLWSKLWTGTSAAQALKLQCRWRPVRLWQLRLREPVFWQKFWIWYFVKNSVENMNQCIDEITKYTQTT